MRSLIARGSVSPGFLWWNIPDLSVNAQSTSCKGKARSGGSLRLAEDLAHIQSRWGVRDPQAAAAHTVSPRVTVSLHESASPPPPCQCVALVTGLAPRVWRRGRRRGLWRPVIQVSQPQPSCHFILIGEFGKQASFSDLIVCGLLYILHNTVCFSLLTYINI